MKKVIILGSGFAGLSSAAFMAKAGWEVTVLEKHPVPGGRARQLKESGFTFDMGPSWYWMPGVFERFFASFGKTIEEYYTLRRLDPSYRVYWPQTIMDIPADYNELKKLFEKTEPGSGVKLDKFLKEAAYKYKVGIHKLVQKPGASVAEFADWDLVKGLFKLDVFKSMEHHVNRHFKTGELRQLLKFPVLFLGALPKDTPALYSLMNYADIKLGTWYPMGGMHQVVEAMMSVAMELGVKFLFNENVIEFNIQSDIITSVITQNTQDTKKDFKEHKADVIISGADYHFTEMLLPAKNRSYSEQYWQSRVMAPSTLIYYIGLNKKIPGLQHHSLFFDVNFETHGEEIYSNPQWPSDPLFYVSATSVTDAGVAPPGCENLFFLIPVAAGLTGDTTSLRDEYFDKILKRFEARMKTNIKDAIIFRRSYSVSNFNTDYNSFKGNAYGLSNTLMQTALFKPGIRSKKLKNLFFTGQLTVPGPGVPPSLVSGEVVSREVVKNYG